MKNFSSRKSKYIWNDLLKRLQHKNHSRLLKSQGHVFVLHNITQLTKMFYARDYSK